LQGLYVKPHSFSRLVHPVVRQLGVLIKRSGRLKNIFGANRLYLSSYKNWSNKPNAWDMNTAANIKQKPTETHLYNGTWKKKYGEKKLVRGSVTQPRFLSRSSARSSTLTNSNPTPPTRKRNPTNNITNWSPSINSIFSAMPNNYYPEKTHHINRRYHA
jgi:hypothetical protein